MGARFRSWWQEIKQHRVAVGVVTFVLVVVIVLIYLEIRFNGTGFAGKTLWDWLQLLIIPAVLAIAGYVINLTISRSEQEATKQRAQSEREAAEKCAETERDIAEDNQREAALQEYIDKISELLLEMKLRESVENDEVRTIARVRTLTVLPRLDRLRKRSILQFLDEAGLIDINEPIIWLAGADLSGADLNGAVLSYAILDSANLIGAHLIEADLTGAYLDNADMRGIDLMGANLNRTNLSEADLDGANLLAATGITIEELEAKTLSLDGATMSNGSIHA